MSDEVGKVSLGLELVGGNDLTKQITAAAGEIGQQLTKSLQSTFGGFSLNGFAANISQTLKSTTETAMKGIADGMEQSVAAVEGRLVKSIDTASQAMKQSIEENKTAAEQAIDSISGKLSGLKGPKFLEKLKLSGDITAGAQAACCCSDGSSSNSGSDSGKRTKAKTKASPEPFDSDAATAEVEHLTKVLDNTNAKLELQHQKLADLKESYENTFNDAAKSKLQEKILNTESTILRLSKQSDDTAAKIWKLDDAIQQAATATQQMGQVAKQAAASNQQAAQASNQVAVASQQAGQATGQAAQQSNRANKSTNKLTSNLHNAARAAAGAGTSFNTAGRDSGKMGNQFTAAFSRILKQVFVFSVLYRAVHDFNSYLGASLKTNAEYAASLNAIQTNLRVAFQPIYEAILPAINALMSFLARATAYIAAFISALFGKTYKQSYDAAKGIETAKKAMEGYGKKAKKADKDAKGALASFDELNTLDFSKKDDSPDAGGGKDFEMKMPEMDIDSIQTQMDKLAADVKAAFDGAWQGVKSGWDWLVSTFGPSFQIAWGEISPVLDRGKEQFRKMFNDVLTLGEPLKNWIHNGLIPFWQKGIELAGHVLAGLGDSALNVVETLWDSVFPILSKFVSEGLPMLTDFMMGAQDIFRRLFDVAKQIFDDIWRGAVGPAMKLISKVVQDTLDIIFKWWGEWGKKIIGGLKDTLDGIKKLWDSLWNGFLKPFVTSMLNMLTQLWDKHLKGLVKEVLDFVGKLASAALDILNKFILPIVNWLVQKLGPIFAEIFNGILIVIGTALGGIVDAARGIIKALGGIIDFIAGVFTGDWKRAWEGIKTFCGGIFDGIVGLFKGAVNMIIDAFNWMLRQVNKLSFDIPDFLGGGTFGIKVPEIPRLAKGGLAYGPTLAMVGDNRGASVDPEVVSPLSKLQDMIGANNQPVVDALMMILDALRSGDKHTVLQIGETEFGRLAIKTINSANRQAGRNLLLI
ncbi:hypothetical protein [Paenibacillus sp. NAIST15-1]|uniref:hypothetical protein n=1 Tax=Paenibacillus sp. NAIST15-1 TaxID=1605994 RepID=UPI00086B1996|nr:hypothetical protein [Paenibacillus sp. NAIST15-1]GAV13232.1 phage-like protein [Paenibacillus sp. NAIST15-1]